MSEVRAPLTPVQRVTLALRVTMEVGVIAALAAWGIRVGSGPVTKALLGVGAPAVGFGIWGAVDFHQAGERAEVLRLGEELAISFGAAAAAYAAGYELAGLALAGLSAGYHGLVYATGSTLLPPTD